MFCVCLEMFCSCCTVQVGVAVYVKFFRALTIPLTTCVVLFYALSYACLATQSFFLTYWTNQNFTLADGSTDSIENNRFLAFYALFDLARGNHLSYLLLRGLLLFIVLESNVAVGIWFLSAYLLWKKSCSSCNASEFSYLVLTFLFFSSVTATCLQCSRLITIFQLFWFWRCHSWKL